MLAEAKHARGGEPWVYWACVSGVACATLIFCALAYRWVEWPFIQYEKESRATASTAELATRAAAETVALAGN